jgi:transcriptional regulator with GAF, ATPase, and Fis domain
MQSIAYWDMDRLRILKVLAELEAAFEIRMAATLDELRAHASDKRVCAVLIGLPVDASEKVAGFFSRFAGSENCPVFILADAWIGQDSAAAAGSAGSHLIGPADIGSLRRMLAAAAADRANSGVDGRLFIGGSQGMRQVESLVRRYAESQLSVLILGETGTGKELVARAIHKLSPRGPKTIVALNCAAIPENLVESELFGAEKGAFTDAQHRRGALARASKGSLFLDEIGSMALNVQPKLLRALESGEYWRLGGDKPEKSDFRLICATGEDLESSIENGLFRKDLFYRISDLPIWIPPLRARLDDIPELAEHFCIKASQGACEISPGALDKLMEYPWPGNVRELKSVINRACAIVGRGTLMPENIIYIFPAASSSLTPSSLAQGL